MEISGHEHLDGHAKAKVSFDRPCSDIHRLFELSLPSGYSPDK